MKNLWRFFAPIFKKGAIFVWKKGKPSANYWKKPTLFFAFFQVCHKI